MSYLTLCLVTNQNHPLFNHLERYTDFIVRAVNGGVTSVQLRYKTPDKAAVRAYATALLEALGPLAIPLILNDDVLLACEVGADGVHLGQTDLSPVEARQCLGPGKIIGWSIETRSQLDAANALDCLDYVAASAVFASVTKRNCQTIWGLSGLRELVEHSRHPMVGIGGIDGDNAADVMQQGAAGIAVVGAIHDTADPTGAACSLINIIHQGMNHAPRHD